MPRQLLGTAIAANTITTTQLQTTIVQNIEGGGGPRVASLIYPGDDTAANTVGGQTVYINGSGFASNSAVYINGNSAPSVSFISSSNLAITTPALSAATYPVYVINPENGATAIFIPGLLVSGDPTWVTSAGSLSASQDASSAWSYSVSATSDSAVTYALASGSSLPTGISLAANGLISGTMSSPPESETTYNFTVEATDAENQNATRAFSVTVTLAEGVLFANNVLLIHADGTNNQNNHAFLDSSNNNFTITRYGNASQGSYSPFSQTGWSGYFDGSGDYLTAPNNAALEFGTGDFTVECWVNSFDKGSNKVIAYLYNSPTNYHGWQLRIDSGGNGYATITVFGGSSPLETNVTGTSNICDGKWHHIAAVRSGTTLSIFVDGVREATTTNSYNITSTATFHIGRDAALTTRDWGGYISNLRIIKGSSPYDATSSTLTPPSAPLAPIANTSLLALQSNRFLDEGPNNFTLTRNGDVSIQPFSPFAPGLLTSNSHSVYFDGSGDWLLTSSSPATLSGDFTVEGWVYITSLSSSRSLVCIGDDFAATGVIFTITNAGKLRLFGSNSIIVTGTSQTVTVNSWNHIAFVRSSGTIKLYLNGVADSTTVSNSTAFTGINRIGGELYNGNSGGAVMLGYISNYRLVNGTAVYTTNFTPPTTPLTAITNTVLLTCQSPTFVDNSINGFTITPAGNAVPRKFNPFGQTYTSTVAYSTANVGGSGYFDGSGDYLIVGASNLTATSTGKSELAVGSGDFTIEGWFNTSTVSPSAAAIFKHYASSGTNDILEIRLVTNTVTVRYRVNGGVEAALTSGTITPEQWYHVAFVRNSGVVKGYLNGIEFGSASFTGNLVTTLSTTTIGCDQLGTSNFTGEISDFRFVKGTAVYTSAFTPPTAPLTNIANTSLLCNFTNAGIFDQTAKNILETVGDAKVSTAEYKYGTGSIAFDGSGDYLTMPNSDLLHLGSGNFTIEFWVYFNAFADGKAVLSKGWSSINSPFLFYTDGVTNVFKFYSSSNGSTWDIANGIAVINSPSLNTWYHVAVTRDGSTFRTFSNGTQTANVTSSATLYSTTQPVTIGAGSGGSNGFNGYIDDLRITRGYARYTANFTAPTSALKDK